MTTVGVVSDTHDNTDAVEDIVALLSDEGVETVLHCGDYIAPPVVDYFEGFDLHGVLGNNDGETAGLQSAFHGIGGTLHGFFADVTVDGTRFAMLHGEDREEVTEYAREGDYDYVLYGHHHRNEVVERDGTTVVNPGAHFPTVPEEHRTVALVDTEGGGVRLERV